MEMNFRVDAEGVEPEKSESLQNERKEVGF